MSAMGTIEQRITDETPLICHRLRASCMALGWEYEDLIAATQLKALAATKNGNGYDPERGQFSTWIHQIAFNELRHHARRHKHHRAFEDAVAVVKDEATHDEVERKLYLQDVMKIISTLSHREADCIRQRFFHGKTLKEIAEDHSLSIQMISNIIESTLNKIRLEGKRYVYNH